MHVHVRVRARVRVYHNATEICWDYLMVTLIPRWLYYRGGCITEVAALPRWLYYRGGCVTVRLFCCSATSTFNKSKRKSYTVR